MTRRMFSALCAVLALGCAVAVDAKPLPGERRIGYLSSGSAASNEVYIQALREGLRDHGWMEGRNITIEFRFAAGNRALLPKLAEELVGLNVDLIVAQSTPVALAAKHATTTIRMALEMRDAMAALGAVWKKRGFDIGFGVGIASGYATIGEIGFEGRRDYGANGTVCNLSARLCGEAKSGQVFISQRVWGKVEGRVVTEPFGELTLKGLRRPVHVYAVSAISA